MNEGLSNETLGEVRTKVMPPGVASVSPQYVASGKGALLYDVSGQEYIDFSGGIAVMNVGHSHPKVIAAIKDQAEKLTHTCFMVMPYEPAVTLAEKLNQITPVAFPKKSMFISSGAEAVENAVKISRYATKKPGIIVFENAFHGRSLLTMTMTSKVMPYKFGFGPFAPEVYRMPFAYCYRCPFHLEYPKCDVACADYLKELLILHTAPENTAALVIEPIQGEGGFITPPPEYLPKLAKICKDNNILFIADEIQTGIGRTGKMFAIEHAGVEPDLMTVAKSFAAGMPLAAVVGREEIMDTVHPGGLGGTYGGNPVCCRAALAVLEIFETENMLQKAEALGQYLESRLNAMAQELEMIGDVRGLGAMRAIELVRDRHTKEPAADEAKALVQYCGQRGLLILSCGSLGNVIRFLMPLVIENEQLEKGFSILEDGLKAVFKK